MRTVLDFTLMVVVLYCYRLWQYNYHFNCCATARPPHGTGNVAEHSIITRDYISSASILLFVSGIIEQPVYSLIFAQNFLFWLACTCAGMSMGSIGVLHFMIIGCIARRSLIPSLWWIPINFAFILLSDARVSRQWLNF